MISFKDEIRELERIREKLEQYENSNVEYKIMMLADQLVTISNSLKDKYDKKYPGRLQKVNQDIYMDQFEVELKPELQEFEKENIVPGTFDDFAEDSFEENTLELDKEEIKETIEKEKHEYVEEEFIEIENDTVLDTIEEIIDKENTQPLVHVFSNHSVDIFFDKIAERMNELTFLYKPIQKENYLEGDYLEKFGSQRDMELQKSNAMKIHNQFWKANTVEHGNIFGSVPLDLINESAATKLLSYGWRLANVVIYDVKVGLDLWELNDHCLREFDNYLIVKEKKDGYTLIFEYNI